VKPALDYSRVVHTSVQRVSLRTTLALVGLVAAILAAVVLVGTLISGQAPGLRDVGVMAGVVAFVALLVQVQSLRITVRSNELIVRLFPFWTTRVPVHEIASVEVATYQPIREFGGWGIRYSFRDSTTAYTIGGTRGVRIVTTRGRKLLVGTLDPEALAAAIDSVRPRP
jgi:hypothetical protein